MSMLLRRYHEEPAAEEVEVPEETPAPKPRRKAPKPDIEKE